MPVYRIGNKTVLFIHIPKTAGMALGAHLGLAGRAAFEDRIAFRGGTFGPRHQPADVLEKVFLPEMIDYAFMVVRHPVARLVSEYRYQRRHGMIQLSRMRVFGFDAWLRYALFRLRTNPDWRVGHFRPQVAYECFNCEIFRYEEGLAQVSTKISSITGITLPQSVSPTNVSSLRPVRIAKSSLNLIAHHYAADFERFNYSREMPFIRGLL